MIDGLASHILREYNSVLDELIERELLIDSNALLSFKSQNGTVLTWSNNTHLSYLFGEHSTVKHYRSILECRDFCFCFIDGGVIQVRYDIEDGEIVAHRLCYFPCPFSFSPEDVEGIALSELPLLFSAEELLMRFRLASPIRFDFDATFNDDYHAYSHVSINKETCRIPVYGPVSLGHFIRFVLRYFYQRDALYIEDWECVRPKLYNRTLQHPSPYELHLETTVTF